MSPCIICSFTRRLQHAHWGQGCGAIVPPSPQGIHTGQPGCVLVKTEAGQYQVMMVTMPLSPAPEFVETVNMKKLAEIHYLFLPSQLPPGLLIPSICPVEPPLHLLHSLPHELRVKRGGWFIFTNLGKYFTIQMLHILNQPVLGEPRGATLSVPCWNRPSLSTQGEPRPDLLHTLLLSHIRDSSRTSLGLLSGNTCLALTCLVDY